ncbi:MAG: ECF transporter S component [Clostridiales bacterium]|jgi:energy-coupling factor transport system substrate-specific component|nr:ECF transporter S component [Clostridiales bacterium]
MKRKLWSFPLTIPIFLLIPAVIGANIIGKSLAELLKLPLWLDSIGTVLAGLIGGPIIGAIAGLAGNIIYSFTISPTSLYYSLTSVAIGLSAGILSRLGFARNWHSVGIIAITIIIVSSVFSTPINVIFYGGLTGNIWGDAIYQPLINANMNLWLASFVVELLIELPDKLFTVMAAYLLLFSLPKKILDLYGIVAEDKYL